MNIILGLLLTIFIATNSHAASVVLQWDANQKEDEVKHYTVYWSNYSGNTKRFAFKNRTSTTATTKTITDIGTSEKLYFRVTATNSTAESEYSNKVYLNFVRTPGSLKFKSVTIR